MKMSQVLEKNVSRLIKEWKEIKECKKLEHKRYRELSIINRYSEQRCRNNTEKKRIWYNHIQIIVDGILTTKNEIHMGKEKLN